MGLLDSILVLEIFAAYAAWIAVRMFAPAPTVVKDEDKTAAQRFLARIPLGVAGTFIGGFSALAGVGGAALTVPLLVARGKDIRQAGAISNVVGLALAFTSCLVYAASSAHQYVAWLPAACLCAAAPFAAPYGVKVAQRLPVPMLRKAFGVCLVFASAAAMSRSL